MADTPLNSVKQPGFTIPEMNPGIMTMGAPKPTTPGNTFTTPGFVSPPSTPGNTFTTPGFPSPPGNANPMTPGTPGILTAPPTPAPPAPYTANAGTAQKATAFGYTPEGFTVDPKQTVQGQITNIIGKDSQLMQQADTRARQQMQGRGLLSSSAAVGAGQAAVVDAAMPIAQQDANTYANANTNTQNAKNAALNFGAGAQNQASQTNAQLGTNVSLTNAAAANKALEDSFQAKTNYGLATLDANTKLALGNLDATTKLRLTQMENDNRQALQANQGAASMFNQVATAIANISQNPNFTKEAKDAAIASQLSLLNEGLTQQGAVAGLDLGSYFQQGATMNAGDPATFDKRPLNGSVPDGGFRDPEGNVYNSDGSKASWRGPVNDVVDHRPGNPSGTPNKSAPSAPQSAPTGTVTNPTQPGEPMPTTNAAPGTKSPGGQWYKDVRGGWKRTG